MTHTLVAAITTIGLAIAPTLPPQETRPPARLTRVEGTAFLDDRPLPADALPVGLPATALLRTTEGRVILSLKVGGTLALDQFTAVRVHENGVYNFNRIDVINGEVIVDTGASSPEVLCPDDVPVGADSRTSRNLVRLSSRGRFRFDRRARGAAPPDGCVLRVHEGAAAVPATSVLLAARPGQEVQLPNGDMIPVREFALGNPDAFDQWTRLHGSR